MNITNWFRSRLGVKDLEKQVAQLNARIADYEQEIIEHTRADVDVAAHYRGRNTVILTGVYRGVGYIRFYDVSAENFRDLVEHMKHVNKFSKVRNIDSPPDFRGLYRI